MTIGVIEGKLSFSDLPSLFTFLAIRIHHDNHLAIENLHNLTTIDIGLSRSKRPHPNNDKHRNSSVFNVLHMLFCLIVKHALVLHYY